MKEINLITRNSKCYVDLTKEKNVVITNENGFFSVISIFKVIQDSTNLIL